MNRSLPSWRRSGRVKSLIGLLLLGTMVTGAVIRYSRGSANPRHAARPRLAYREKVPLDAGGFSAVLPTLRPWQPSASLEEISFSFRRAGHRLIDRIDRSLTQEKRSAQVQIVPLLMKAACLNYEAEPDRAYQLLEQVRSRIEDRPALDGPWHFSV